MKRLTKTLSIFNTKESKEEFRKQLHHLHYQAAGPAGYSAGRRPSGDNVCMALLGIGSHFYRIRIHGSGIEKTDQDPLIKPDLDPIPTEICFF